MGLKQFPEILKPRHRLPYFLNIHIGKEPNNINLLILIIPINQYDNNIADKKQPKINRQEPKIPIKIIRLNALNDLQSTLPELPKHKEHGGKIVTQVIDI